VHERAKKVAQKTRPNFSTSGKFATIAKMQKNVKCKSFLNEKRYGFPLLRREFSKTRFARKRKKLRENKAQFFHIWKFLPQNSCTKKSKNVKSKSFLNEKSYGIPLLRR
jgi:hypothetical protein